MDSTDYRWFISDHIDEDMIDVAEAKEAEELYKEKGAQAFIKLEELEDG